MGTPSARGRRRCFVPYGPPLRKLTSRQATGCRPARPVRGLPSCAMLRAGRTDSAERTRMMANPPRRIGFVLAATEHGTMILNRFDYRHSDQGTYGVGHQLLNNA